jgi:hypothetical protein
MNRGLIILVLVLFGIQTITLASVTDSELPANIRNNRFFVESLRLNNLARLAYDEGNYIASMDFSEEAIRFANLSNEYVLLQLKIMECDNAIAAARRRLDFVESLSAATRYPFEYGVAQVAFGEARTFRAEERWDDAIAAAHRVLAALANISELPLVAELPDDGVMLPSQYTVRTWEIHRDCLWNIAGSPWVYNDPWQWRRLFEANRDRMPQRDNPDLIHPGMILVIPPIGGEVRQGMWEEGREYPSLPAR